VSTVHPDRFGKDHWSMLAYVETCVDGSEGVGQMSRKKLRCNSATHPLNAHMSSWDRRWGTKLAGYFSFADRADVDKSVSAGLMLPDHDDWDCLVDLEAAGYVEVISMAGCLVRMTDHGQEVCAQIRAHKVSGGHFGSFVLRAVAQEAVERPRA